MSDNVDFERRLQDLLLAHASRASRPFDPQQIAAAAATGRFRTVRPSTAWRPVALLVAAVLLLILAIATALTVGSAVPWFRADQEVVPGPLAQASPTALPTAQASPAVAPTLLATPDVIRTPAATPYLAGASLTWTSQPAMTEPRAGHTATVLSDGRVLVAGGDGTGLRSALASAEIFDPATSSWTLTGPMTTGRAGHQALLLPDGRVIVIGGRGYNSETTAEIWDPSTGQWAAIGGAVLIINDSAALLPDDRILVAGGTGATRAAVLDPATGTVTQTDHYSEVRYNVSLITLRDGTILMIGGDRGADRGMAAVERFDPSTNGWSVVGSLKEHTHTHGPTLLDDGRILAVGADGSSQNFAQLFDPASGESRFVNGSLPAWARMGGGVRLTDGRVLFAADDGMGVFDPASDAWESISPMLEPRWDATKSRLPTGGLLVVGGYPSPDGITTVPSAAVELLR